ncbi:hypothetical protein H112_08142, partial [Trichophyton rubrum D6]
TRRLKRDDLETRHRVNNRGKASRCIDMTATPGSHRLCHGRVSRRRSQLVRFSCPGVSGHRAESTGLRLAPQWSSESSRDDDESERASEPRDGHLMYCTARMRCLAVCMPRYKFALRLVLRYYDSVYFSICTHLIYGGTIWPPASDGRGVEVSSSAWEHRIPAPPSAGMKDVTGQGEASRRRGTAARGTSDLDGRAQLGCAAWSRVPFARVLRHSRPGQHPSPSPIFTILQLNHHTRKRKRDVQGQLARSEPEELVDVVAFPSTRFLCAQPAISTSHPSTASFGSMMAAR